MGYDPTNEFPLNYSIIQMFSIARLSTLHQKDEPFVRTFGSKFLIYEWKDENGKLHRDGDLPAVSHPYYLKWYRHGKLHRDGDLPAVEWCNGDKEWWKDGKRHRKGGPAIVIDEKNEEWWRDGVRHRDDDDEPARIEFRNFEGGKRCEWWKDGKRHRLNGHAIVQDDGHSEKWIDGVRQ